MLRRPVPHEDLRVIDHIPNGFVPFCSIIKILVSTKNNISSKKLKKLKQLVTMPITVSDTDSKKSKKIITIFGCGGNRDQSKRSKMAKIADRNSDFIYLTEDNSRFEKLQDITNDILKGFTTNNYEIINDRQKAIEKALIDNDNSIFLILGKGVENYQLRKGVKYPHSDIEIVKNFINENNN